MPGILDRFIQQNSGTFHPQTTHDLFALHLALRLNDGPTVRHYRQMLDQHGQEKMLAAYKKVLRASPKAADLGRAFHSALDRVSGNGGNGHRHHLLAVSVERRSVAVAFFIGTDLDYAQKHNLPSNPDKAEPSAIGFINLMLANLKTESAAMEELDARCDSQRMHLSAAIHAELGRRGLPIWMADNKALLASFGHPCPRSHVEVRTAVRAICPLLGPNDTVLDAVALGLYVQTARQFPAAE
jgi:hypothetical protein